ncbi:hypothetical protein AB0M87_11130 [Streptomyces sp. NPDC051320]|uniref:hypothetical protein n=1 Tax=Streptomyces sp. NPDC051320 TaxID=3154644 RepID=UPI0034196E97
MQDRRHRATLRTPLQEQVSMLLRERRPSSTEPDDNPFAPPPEDRPEQPWQPRHPANGDEESSSSEPSSPGRGSQWSPVQPGRQDGGFGSGPQRPKSGPNEPDGGQGGKGGPGPGLRWDPTDPVQRRARYALLAGMWAFFFALFNLPQVGLLLGALAVYWGVSSLRAEPRQRAGGHPALHPRTDATARPTGPPAAPAAPGPYPGSSKPQITAAVSGLVTAGLALLIVALTFTSQLVYRDYYTCVHDSLTKQGQLACNSHLPDSLVPILGTKK